MWVLQEDTPEEVTEFMYQLSRLGKNSIAFMFIHPAFITAQQVLDQLFTR